MEVRLAYNKRIMSSIALNSNFWSKNLNPSVSLLSAMAYSNLERTDRASSLCDNDEMSLRGIFYCKIPRETFIGK